MSREKSYVNIMYRHVCYRRYGHFFDNYNEICNVPEKKFKCFGTVISFTSALTFSSTFSIVRMVRKRKENRSGAILCVCITTDIYC